MPDTLSPLDLFSDQYICPNCNSLDHGRFCSECGHELRIPRDQVADALTLRLKTFEFKPFEEWLASNAEAAAYHDLSFLATVKGRVLCKEDQPSNGLRLQLVFIVEEGTDGEGSLKTLIRTYIRGRAAAIARVSRLRRKERPVSSQDFLERIDIHAIVIKDVQDAKGELGQRLAMVRIPVRTGVWAGLLRRSLLLPHIIRSSFTLKIRIDIGILNYADGKFYPASHRLYDIVNHQAGIIAAQTRVHDAPAEERTPGSLEALYAVIDAFRDYFKILAQYIQNPGFFPGLIATRKVIPLKKILALYFTGLVCSITLPWLLTGGYLNSSKLGLFSALPPFLGDLAELCVDLLRITISCLLLHLLMRMFGKKGSLSTLLLCFLFYESFIQVLERPVRYLTGSYLYHLSNSNFQLQISVQTLVFGCLWFIAAYFIFPILFAVYQATRRMIGTAYIVVSLFFGFCAGFIHGFSTAYDQGRFGNEVDYHYLQVFYDDGATREEAVRLKDYLVTQGVGGTPVSTQLIKDDSGDYVFREVIRSDAKIDPSIREFFSELTVSLSYKVFNGAEVKAQLCDRYFKPLMEIRMPPAARLTMATDSDYVILYPNSWNFQKGGDDSAIFHLYSIDSSAGINLKTDEFGDTVPSLDAYRNVNRRQMDSLFGKRMVPNVDSIETHDDKPCWRMLYTLDFSPDRKKVRVEQYIWIVRRKAYILTFETAIDAADDRRLTIGQLILNSFSIRQ